MLPNCRGDFFSHPDNIQIFGKCSLGFAAVAVKNEHLKWSV
jgi:hypothetical protein